MPDPLGRSSAVDKDGLPSTEALGIIDGDDARPDSDKFVCYAAGERGLDVAVGSVSHVQYWPPVGDFAENQFRGRNAGTPQHDFAAKIEPGRDSESPFPQYDSAASGRRGFVQGGLDASSLVAARCVQSNQGSNGRRKGNVRGVVPGEAEVGEMVAMTVCDRGPVNCNKTRTVAEHEQPGNK